MRLVCGDAKLFTCLMATLCAIGLAAASYPKGHVFKYGEDMCTDYFTIPTDVSADKTTTTTTTTLGGVKAFLLDPRDDVPRKIR